MKSRTLYSYNLLSFQYLKNQYKEQAIELIPAIKMDAKQIKLIQENPEKYVVDISDFVEYLNERRSEIHTMTLVLSNVDFKIKFICDERLTNLALEILRYVFDTTEKLEGSLITTEEDATTPQKRFVKKITDLEDEELNNFFTNMDISLVGHEKFKQDLRYKVQSFRLFNKLKQQKILSLFLMGESGIGKTQVGRIIHNELSDKTSLCKISFGNYSSKDSLNSLIGSPRGYMGSETGELPLRIEKSDAGIILIDEFEKADNPVYNFFLDLLEEGKFSDSQSKIYDMDGYIIIFTSNLTKEEFYKKISPELRSRFDYVCYFELLSLEDKNNYLQIRIEQTLEKFEKVLDVKVSNEDKLEIYNIDVNNLTNLRKINQIIKDKFTKLYESYLKK